MRIERKILIGVSATLMFGDSLWYDFNRNADEPNNVLLTTTLLSSAFTDRNLIDELPYYDQAQAAWIKNGVEVKDISTELVNDDPHNLGPDSLGRYVVVRLQKNADTTAYIDTIRALASKGICLVALVDTTNPRQAEGVFWADMSRIIQVKNDHGQPVNCHDRFNI
ncbi:hypothetical protein [Sphingorhabdus sp. 109]|jgi:hypothetical protein|uniref:hypothetical protein n=1 Tax=Sphingorhabdus sp. 109 TaxID=2653173 RepID=UPI0012EF2741|nr:hypothetical protein [Sphingorhabdus sp. 109]VWX57038.1 conserved hypothetical protein [Sphingorhabdus sp. 109]